MNYPHVFFPFYKKFCFIIVGTIIAIACNSNKKKSIEAHIPSNGIALATIQTSNLAAKLILDKTGDYDLEEVLLKMKEEWMQNSSIYTSKQKLHQLLENPSEFGIDLFSETYFYFNAEEKTNEFFLVAYFKVSNKEKLENYLSKTFHSVIPLKFGENGNYSYAKSLKGSAIAGWNDYVLIWVIPIGDAEKIKPAEQLDKLMELDDSESILENYFAKQPPTNDDITFVVNIDYLKKHHLSNNRLFFFVDDFHFLNVYFNFRKGSAEIRMEGKVLNEKRLDYEHILQANQFDSKYLTWGNKNPFCFLHLQFNPQTVPIVIKELKLRTFVNMILMPSTLKEEEFYELLNGGLFITISKKNDNQTIFAQLNTKPSMNQFLKDLSNYGILAPREKGFIFAQNSKSPLYLELNDSILWITSPAMKKEEIVSVTLPIEHQTQIKQNPISFTLYPQEMKEMKIPYLLENPSNETKILLRNLNALNFYIESMKEDYVKTHLKLNFLNEQVSGFSEIVRIWQQFEDYENKAKNKPQ
ncbi:MAG: hypothetical protein OHK0038_04310 [Flammeovirgaceae bacterium]